MDPAERSYRQRIERLAFHALSDHAFPIGIKVRLLSGISESRAEKEPAQI